MERKVKDKTQQERERAMGKKEKNDKCERENRNGKKRAMGGREMVSVKDRMQGRESYWRKREQ